ncbi:MAG: phenylacetate-CoA oxygenase subunit PaaJ [Bacteroidota bacterium]|jgi:ring-1,2-phenylacetyl-CoA epoxidase subunit PaaD
MVTIAEISAYLDEVFDPEIPVLTIRDLGMLQHIHYESGNWQITIIPTYSGCPAMQQIEADIRAKLHEKGIDNVQVSLVLSPAWTTDMISEEGRHKLQLYGIAPPVNEPDKSVLFAEAPVVPCPKCRSKETKMISLFGSTACKAHYQCQSCLEPFDYFKCLK